MRKSIYIAERDDALREDLVRYFDERREFFVCGATENQRTAAEFIRAERPDILLTDIVLEAGDGYDLIEKTKEFSPGTEIYVLSALYKEAFITKAIALGAKYYMVKPVDLETLSKRILAPIEETAQSRLRRNKGLDERITNIFISVGIPAHIKGYQFLREAIKMAVERPEVVNSITKKLYPTIAERYDTSSSKVERAIRHAIEVAWNKGKIDSINNLFGIKVYSASDKPTNGEFIALVADKMLIEGV